MNIKIPIRDIKEIIKDTPEELHGKKFGMFGDYRSFEYIGWAKKKNANWLYFVYAVEYRNKYKNITYLVTIGDIIQ
jgi:hypothetical protein